MKNVIVIGTGGHAKVVTDIILSSGDHLVGYLTSDQNKDTFLGKPILGDIPEYVNYKDCSFLIAIGDPDARERIANSMIDVKWHTAIHPTAVVSKLNTSIGEGSVVMPNAVINPFAQIGTHCIINTSANVEHEDTLEDFVHISVGAKLAGNVRVGRKTWVGLGAIISNRISVCENCIIGAGAVVVKDIDVAGTYVGVPARRMK